MQISENISRVYVN